MSGSGSDNNDGKNFGKMLEGRKNLSEGFYIVKKDEIDSYKNLDDALTAYTSKLKELAEIKNGYTKPTLVASQKTNDTPTRSS